MKGEIMPQGEKVKNRQFDIFFYTCNSGAALWIDVLRHCIIVQQSLITCQKAGQHIAR